MAVFRINTNKNYTSMSNYHLKDKNLSLKGKGLLSFMLSLPETWDYSIQGLISVCKENETAIKSTLDELKSLGYLIVIKKMPNETESGRIEYIYDIYEVPKQGVEKQGLENLGVEFLGVENQGQINTNNKILNNKKIKINNISSSFIKYNNIYDILQDNGFILTPIHYEVIQQWEDNDLTRYAIKKAVLNGKHNINYIDKILYNWKKENITTLEQAKAQEQDFEKAKEFREKLKNERKMSFSEKLDMWNKEWEDEEKND